MDAIAELLHNLYHRMQAVSRNVYINIDPDFAPEPIEDFVLISAIYELADRGAYRQSYIRFHCYAKLDQLQNENIPRLQEMASSIMAMFPIKGKRWEIIRPTVAMGGRRNLFSYVTIHAIVYMF